jgi:hypothetical protein
MTKNVITNVHVRNRYSYPISQFHLKLVQDFPHPIINRPINHSRQLIQKHFLRCCVFLHILHITRLFEGLVIRIFAYRCHCPVCPGFRGHGIKYKRKRCLADILRLGMAVYVFGRKDALPLRSKLLTSVRLRSGNRGFALIRVVFVEKFENTALNAKVSWFIYP